MAPRLKVGWLKKKSRGGMLISNWQRRYFVLESGKITYFEKKAVNEQAPYGENHKGDLTLTATSSVCFAHEEKGADAGTPEQAQRRLVLKGGGPEKGMLIEAEDVDEAKEWYDAIAAHIRFAHDGVNVEEHNPRGSDYEVVKTVIPTPGFVLKTKRTTDNTKVFINICHDRDVPTANAFKGSARWPFMIPSTMRKYKDKDGSEYSVYDIVVNSQVMHDCDDAQDEGHLLRDMVCNKSLRRLAKQYNEELEKDYTVPKSNKGFKGDTKELPPISLSSDAITNARRSSIAKGFIGIASAVTGKRTLSTETNGPDAGNIRASTSHAHPSSGTASGASPPATEVRKSPTPSSNNAASNSSNGGSSKDRENQNQHNDSTSPSSKKSSAPSPKDVALVKRKVPYLIVNSSGAVLKPDPSKFFSGNNSRGVALNEGDYVSVIGRIVIEEQNNLTLLRCVGLNGKDGWIPETSNGKMLAIPGTDDKIVGTRIVRWNLAKPKSDGWFGSSDKMFRLVMYFELQYPRDHVVRISRDIGDVMKMREAIINTSLNKKLSFVTFPLAYANLDGQEAMVNDLQNLLGFMDILVEWISHIVRKSEFHRVDEVRDFIKPNEEDRKITEIDLMASGGFGGAFANEMQWE